MQTGSESYVRLSAAHPLEEQPVHLKGERRDRGRFEQQPQPYSYAESITQTGDELRPQQRVPAEFEEIAVDAHAIEPEQRRNDVREPLLRRVARADVGVVGQARCDFTSSQLSLATARSS